jgi:hypothetical protein
MWIVFGTGVKAKRVPGGAKVERHCDQCGELASFYEKEVTATFRLYFVDVFDYQRHRVMACGCCGACYATDELGTPAGASLGESAARAMHGVSGYIDRAASALEAGVSSLLSSDRAPPSRIAAPSTASTASRVGQGRTGEPARSTDEDRREDDEPTPEPVKARFREVEKKPGVRIKID